MNIIFAGYPNSALISQLAANNITIINTEDRISPDFIVQNNIQILISYGYRHIIKADVLQALNGQAFNLHISLLPWNRGTHPNFWSFFDATPSGVSIHQIDTGLDTGQLLAQQEIIINPSQHTLSTSYSILRSQIEQLFLKVWPSIINASYSLYPQALGGTFHKTKDLEKLFPLLSHGWDTALSEVVKMGEQYRNRQLKFDCS